MKIFRLLFFTFVLSFLSFAQTAMIKTEALTPHRLTSLGFTTNSVSSGLNVVPNQTYVYLSAWNVGDNQPITSAVFELISKPPASTASLEVINPTWVQFKPDVLGTYTVKLTITTGQGTHDTTANIYSSSFVGVGNFAGTSAQFPQCMGCHAQDFADIFNRWKTSGHAIIFQRELETSTHYSANCMKCHTTGYDHNIAASNNGFDDIAAQLGWSYVPPSNNNMWDSLVTNFPGLVNHATIGCENCHGPGREHAYGGHVEKIGITLEAGNCAQCHDEPWRHNKYSEFENSLHSEALWSNSFAQGSSSQNNSLQNCIRCHDGNGFVNFTKGLTTNTTGMKPYQQMKITCAACHDPHGNNNDYSLRNIPVGSDTLGNGYQYTLGGNGRLCMNCHKARRDNVVYTASGTVNSHWGPHHSVQADVLLGQNAAEFNGVSYVSGYHKFALVNSCVDCHMVATTDTGTVTRDKVGGHSFSLHNEDSNYDHTKACVPCHGERDNFESFEAAFDYDGDGAIESIREEIQGLERLLRIFLPPYGIDSIAISQINTTELRKAYWNYQLIAYDGSGGMHNPRFAIDVLYKTIIALNGVIPVQLTTFQASFAKNIVTLTWETATETNNRGFEIEKKFGNVWKAIGFKEGKGTTTEYNKYSFADEIKETVSGKIYYRLKQIDFDGTFSYSKEVNIDIVSGPKEFALEQNYPNPFNPATTIKFTVPFESKVKIVVHNIAGEMVKELVNDIVPAGSQNIEFNITGLNLSSGIYFYTIEANALDGSKSFRQTKKMVLLK